MSAHDTDLTASPRQNDAFSAAVLDGLPEAVIVTDPEGRIVFVNRALSVLLDYAPDAVIGRPITLLTPRQEGRRADPVKWLARWAAEPDFEQSRHLDLMARRGDGRQMLVEVRVREDRIAGDRRFLITVRDNTARREAQASLRAENLRAARVLMVAEDAIVTIDQSGRIQDFNLAAEQMFGYQGDEVIGRPLAMLIPPWARETHDGLVAEFAVSRDPSRMMSQRAPIVGQRRNGETFSIEATITKVEVGGAVTFSAHLRDVTERNRARDELRESVRRIRAVFDNAQTPIALLTPDGDILEINAAARALAAPHGAAADRKLWDVPWLTLGGAPASGGAALKDAILAAGAGRSGSITSNLLHDGVNAAVQITLTPVSDQGVIVYVLVEARFLGV